MASPAHSRSGSTTDPASSLFPDTQTLQKAVDKTVNVLPQNIVNKAVESGMRKTQIAALAILCAAITSLVVGLLIVYYPVAAFVFFIALGAAGTGAGIFLIYDYVKHRQKGPQATVQSNQIKKDD